MDSPRARGFISYAHDDHHAYEELRTHLGALERAFSVEFWADKRICPGDYWTGDIRDAIEGARIHLLLVTPAFLNSAYIMDGELPAINAKYHANSDLVVPIILQRCTWKPFVSALQAVPVTHQGRLQAVVDWKPKNHGFNAACEQLMAGLEKFVGPAQGAFDWKPRS